MTDSVRRLSGSFHSAIVPQGDRRDSGGIPFPPGSRAPAGQQPLRDRRVSQGSFLQSPLCYVIGVVILLGAIAAFATLPFWGPHVLSALGISIAGSVLSVIAISGCAVGVTLLILTLLLARSAKKTAAEPAPADGVAADLAAAAELAPADGVAGDLAAEVARLDAVLAGFAAAAAEPAPAAPANLDMHLPGMGDLRALFDHADEVRNPLADDVPLAGIDAVEAMIAERQDYLDISQIIVTTLEAFADEGSLVDQAAALEALPRARENVEQRRAELDVLHQRLAALQPPGVRRGLPEGAAAGAAQPNQVECPFCHQMNDFFLDQCATCGRVIEEF